VFVIYSKSVRYDLYNIVCNVSLFSKTCVYFGPGKVAHFCLLTIRVTRSDRVSIDWRVGRQIVMNTSMNETSARYIISRPVQNVRCPTSEYKFANEQRQCTLKAALEFHFGEMDHNHNTIYLFIWSHFLRSTNYCTY